jgi:hypothetical protein
MLNKNNDEDSNDPSQPSLAGFSVGDWVEVNEHAHTHNKTTLVKEAALSKCWQQSNKSRHGSKLGF